MTEYIIKFRLNIIITFYCSIHNKTKIARRKLYSCECLKNPFDITEFRRKKLILFMFRKTLKKLLFTVTAEIYVGRRK